MKWNRWIGGWLAAVCLVAVLGAGACAQEDPAAELDDPAANLDKPAEPPPKPEAPPKIVKLGNVRAYVAEKRVEMDGVILLESGAPIEVFACTPSGKIHETVMTTDVMPRHVHAALLLIGLERGKPVDFQGEDMTPTGDPVKISVRWKEGDNVRTVRAEDMLYNIRKEAPMAHQYWIFCGSVEDPENPENPYLADLAGNIITTYHDAATVIDNPAEGGVDDEMLTINGEVCPKPGTPVTLILEPGPKPKPKE